MKKHFFVFGFLFLRLISFAQTDTLVLNGVYEGKNIYVQSEGVSPVTVVINGNKSTDPYYEGAFEIDLSHYQFNTGDSVHVLIIHKKDSPVKIFNNEIIDPIVTVEYLGISIDSVGMLKWKTKNEISKFSFTVEQYRWNKWVKVGEVNGKGGYGENEYSFQTIPISGENKFRVKQFNYGRPPKISDTAVFISKLPTVKLKSVIIQGKIEFDVETRYEIYDDKGNIVKVGSGKTVDCTKLHAGDYFLNYDNTTAEIEIR
jgi:hypothetical protein